MSADTSLRVAVAQIDVVSLDSEANLRRMEKALDELAAQRPALVAFPELTSIGQVGRRDAAFGAAYAQRAERLDGPFVRGVAELARRHRCHVVVGLAEADAVVSGLTYNTVVVVDPAGDLVLRQRKLHPAGEERHYFAAGTGVAVADTELGPLAVAVCYDLYFPEVARAAALGGAELLVGVFNVTHRPEWPDRLAQLAAVRCYENMQHVVAVNRVGAHGERRFGGESAVATPPGIVVHRSPGVVEDLVCVDLDREVLRRERAYRMVLADRRPELYRVLPRGGLP